MDALFTSSPAFSHLKEESGPFRVLTAAAGVPAGTEKRSVPRLIDYLRCTHNHRRPVCSHPAPGMNHSRKRSRMLQRLQERSFPKRLWQQQEGQCPVCGQLIDDEDQWLIRPVVPIKAGGTRSLANLKMLHSPRHRRFRITNGKFSASDDRVSAPCTRGFIHA